MKLYRSFVHGLLLVAVLAAAAGCVPGSRSEPSGGPLEVPFLVGGIQVNEADHAAWAEGLQRAGMNAVAVTVYAHQGDWNTDHIWFEDTDEAVISEIRRAKERDLQVVLILRLALDHAFEENRFLWHGMIQPQTEAQLHSWFDQYTVFVLRWAAIAEAEGVDLLGVASELNALASTLPVEELPNLEEYYLNEVKQAEYREGLLRHGAEIEGRHLWTAGSDGFASLEQMVGAETAKKAYWARRVTFLEEAQAELETRPPPPADAAPSEEAPDAEALPPLEAIQVELINRRRALLEEEWRELVAETRGAYTGPLTFAANFDQYFQVGFWDALDVMGVNAYFPLRRRLAVEDPEELLALLRSGWRGVLGEIASFRREQELGPLPVVFTELGYTFQRGSTVKPWESVGFAVVAEEEPSEGEAPVEATSTEERLVVFQDRPVDHVERSLAVRALRQAAWWDEPGVLAGVLYWKLTTEPVHVREEPFVLRIDAASPDPLLAELALLRYPPVPAPGDPAVAPTDVE